MFFFLIFANLYSALYTCQWRTVSSNQAFSKHDLTLLPFNTNHAFPIKGAESTYFRINVGNKIEQSSEEET